MASEKLFSARSLTALILPLMAELALTLMVGMIDSVMVCSAGEAAVSGVSLVDIVFQILIYLFAAFGTGGAVVAGQYLGAKNPQKARATAQQLLSFSLALSMAVMALVYLIRPLLLDRLFGAISPEVRGAANQYLLIVALSIPPLSVYESGAAIFRTMGNSRVTLYISAMMNVINFCGNAMLIYGLRLGPAGAAAATVLSRTAAAAVVFGLLNRPYRADQPLYLEKKLFYRPDRFLIRRILAIGVPNSVENGLFQAGKIILACLAAAFGTSAIAANAVCQSIANVQVIPGTAMILAATAVIARCVGAGDMAQARYYNRVLTGTAYGITALFCGSIWFALPWILSWYRLSPETAALTSQMVLAHTLGAVLIWPLAFVLPSSLRAAGDAKFVMGVSILSMWLFRIGAAYLMAYRLNLGALALWAAMNCDWLFRALVFCFRWNSGKWSCKIIKEDLDGYEWRNHDERKENPGRLLFRQRRHRPNCPSPGPNPQR